MFRRACVVAALSAALFSVPVPALAQLDLNRVIPDAASKALETEPPLKLDQSSAFAQVPEPANFHPRHLYIGSEGDLNEPLAPGDYSVDVIAFCTQWSIHRPGRGLPYKLAKVQGQLADAISALIARGCLQRISPYELNADAWRIEAGTSLSKWPPHEQDLVHRLIPEYERRLQGDYLERIQSQYDQITKVGRILGKRFPPLTDVLAGSEPGRAVLQIFHARDVLADKAIADDKMPDMLYQKTGDGSPPVIQARPGESPSEWSEIQPGVIARYTILDGNMGRNLFEFRVLPQAWFVASLSGDIQVGATAGGVLGMGNPVGTNPNLNIGYSVTQPAQALMASAVPSGGKADIVFNGKTVTGKTVNINAGSPVFLSASASSGLTVQSVKWSVQGATLGGYEAGEQGETITPANLTGDKLKFYWIIPGQSNKVTLDYTLSNGASGSADATFNVQGPTGVSVTTKLGKVEIFDNQQKVGLGQGTTDDAGITFTGKGMNGVGGEFWWMQVIDEDKFDYEDVNRKIFHDAATGGLDKQYPYYVGQVTNDSPDSNLASGSRFTEMQRTFLATMYVMWKADDDSILIPVGSVQWGFIEVVLYDPQAKKWVVKESNPRAAGFAVSNSYPSPSWKGLNHISGLP